MRGLFKAVGIALVGLACGASPAAADDASLLVAYNGHQPELEQAMDEYSGVIRQVRNHQATDDQFRALITANSHIDGVLRVIASEVRHQTRRPTTARRRRSTLCGRSRSG